MFETNSQPVQDKKTLLWVTQMNVMINGLPQKSQLSCKYLDTTSKITAKVHKFYRFISISAFMKSCFPTILDKMYVELLDFSTISIYHKRNETILLPSKSECKICFTSC